jgi:CelD/BcsL family acetyltransferase involved in cellulose biosynthesis
MAKPKTDISGLMLKQSAVAGIGSDVYASAATVEVVSDDKTFARLRGEWNNIVKSSSATIFQTFEWQYLWWKYFGTGHRRILHLLVIRIAGTIVGIGPFFKNEKYFLGKKIYSKLQLLGCGVAQNITEGMISAYGPSDYLDIIALPQYEVEVSIAIVDYLQIHKSLYDEIDFSNVPEDSVVMRQVVPEIRRLFLLTKIVRTDICPRLKTPASIDSFFQEIKPTVRRRFSQSLKAVGELFTIESIQTVEEMHTAFQNLIGLHQRRWNQLGFPGLFTDKRFHSFQVDIANAFFENGWLWLKTARNNGTCAAVRLGFVFNNRLYDYLSGFDENSSASKRRPGVALLLNMMEDAIQLKLDRLDFLRGDESYKFEFTSEASYNWEIHLLNGDVRSSFRVQLYRVIKFVQFMIALICKEWKLFHVQYREHGLLFGLSGYVKFRTQRFTRKVQRKNDAE